MRSQHAGALAVAAASFAGVALAAPLEAELLENGQPDYWNYEAQVVDVIDGDTIRVEVALWPGHTLRINVRSRGVDAPEIRLAECASEKQLGHNAKESIERKFPVGSWVLLRNVSHDKYGDRVVADIDRWISDRFQSVTEELLDQEGRWGVRWDGTSPTYDWCEGRE